MSAVNKKANIKNNKSSKNNKNTKNQNGSNILKAVSKAMPYILTVSFVVLLFSLIGLLGSLGTVLKNVTNGLFSNFASYFIPFFMLYHAIMWYYDTRRKICFRRIVCSFFALFGMSTLQHIITTTVDTELAAVKNLGELYELGKNGQGGGVLGGLFTRALTSIGGNIVAIIIVFIILTLMLLQMFNITPRSMFKAAKSNNGKKKPRNNTPSSVPSKNKTKVKHRSVDIFDDDDDNFDNTITDLELSGTVEVSTGEEETKNQASAKPNNGFNEHRDQLEPYDASKDYSAQDEDLVITKNKLGSDEKEEIISNYEKEDTAEFVFEVKRDTEKYKIDDIQIEDTVVDAYDEVDNANNYTVYKSEAEDYTEYVSIQDDNEDEEEYIPLEDLQDDEIEEEASYNTSTYAEPEVEKEEDTYEGYNEPEKKKEDDLSSVLSGKAFDIISGKEKIIKPSHDTDLVSTVKAEETKKAVKEEPKKAPPKPKIPYKFPPLDFLKSKSQDENEDEIREELQENARKIVTTLNDFGVRTRIVDIARGPTVTRYEIAPEAGVRVKSIANLADDIALNLAAEGIRIESPIPGKSAVGIEVPNKTTSFVYLKDLLAKDKFKNAKGVLTCAVGKSISGDDIYMDVEKTPHLLVAGATGMGKSVCINSLLISMLYKASPEDLRLILIDPKRVELSNYNGIPHLLVPVVCEPKKSLGALQWAVTEMENRFETIETAGVRNLTEFNEKVDNGYEAEKMSRIVIIIDELADLKMAVPDIEGHITRLTQKARAAGIHIIIGTQRPSVDVITGLIKNNIPSRIAFRVPSQVDSRTILDEQGAEKLVSRGDMLVKLVDALKPARVQGAYVSASEIEDVINFLKSNGEANYDESVMQQIDTNAAKIAKAEKKDSDEEGGCDDELDSEFYNALRLAAEEGKISSSLLQRKLKLGFQRAARIIDQMYDLGYIGDPNGSKPRDVLITIDDYREIMMRREDDEE